MALGSKDSDKKTLSTRPSLRWRFSDTASAGRRATANRPLGCWTRSPRFIKPRLCGQDLIAAIFSKCPHRTFQGCSRSSHKQPPPTYRVPCGVVREFGNNSTLSACHSTRPSLACPKRPVAPRSVQRRVTEDSSHSGKMLTDRTSAKTVIGPLPVVRQQSDAKPPVIGNGGRRSAYHSVELVLPTQSGSSRASSEMSARWI